MTHCFSSQNGVTSTVASLWMHSETVPMGQSGRPDWRRVPCPSIGASLSGFLVESLDQEVDWIASNQESPPLDRPVDWPVYVGQACSCHQFSLSEVPWWVKACPRFCQFCSAWRPCVRGKESLPPLSLAVLVAGGFGSTFWNEQKIQNKTTMITFKSPCGMWNMLTSISVVTCTISCRILGWIRRCSRNLQLRCLVAVHTLVGYTHCLSLSL